MVQHLGTIKKTAYNCSPGGIKCSNHIFIDILKVDGLCLTYLGNLLSDWCAVLCGKKTGVVKRLTHVTPDIRITDTGEDDLHYANNTHKRAGQAYCPRTDNMQNNIKCNFRESLANVDYRKLCLSIHNTAKMPLSY